MSSVHTHGPVVDGRAPGIVDRWARYVEDRLAQRAVDQIHARLAQVIRHPTGYYESHIRSTRVSSGRRVDDDRVVYGPWLEGVGSRNSPVTRFPGYHTFRLVGQNIEREAAHLAGRDVDVLVDRLNGDRA